MDPVFRHFSHILRQSAEDPEAALILLRELWPQIVGKALSPRTEPLSLKNGVLEVGVTPPSWNRQLVSLKGILRRRINECWGLRLVEKIELNVHLSEHEKGI